VCVCESVIETERCVCVRCVYIYGVCERCVVCI